MKNICNIKIEIYATLVHYTLNSLFSKNKSLHGPLSLTFIARTIDRLQTHAHASEWPTRSKTASACECDKTSTYTHANTSATTLTTSGAAKLSTTYLRHGGVSQRASANPHATK